MSGHLRVLTQQEWHARTFPAEFAWTLSPLGMPIEVGLISFEAAVCDAYFSPCFDYAERQEPDFGGVRAEILAEVYFRAQLLDIFAELVCQPQVADYILALDSNLSYYPLDVETAQALTRTLLSLRAAKSALSEFQYLT